MKCPICKGTGEEIIYYDSKLTNAKHIECRVCAGSGEIKPKVLNRKVCGIPNGAVYIGRGSKWGNPFKIGRDGNRDEVIRKYIDWFLEDPTKIEAAKNELADRNLVCYCAPDRCHGDFLLKIANSKGNLDG